MTLQAQMMLPAYQAVQYKNSGIVLQSVTIGTQIWMAKNLDVTTYRDGTPIPQVTDPAEWANLTTGAWCYYNNDPAYGLIYGKLYNWFAVAGIHDNDPNTPNKTLAPLGYHIPTDLEWTSLGSYLGGDSIAGGKMKEIGTAHWKNPNSANNASGFTALPGGYRKNIDGSFISITVFGMWWTATESSPTHAWNSYLYNEYEDSYRSAISKKIGLSVRCVKD